MRRLRELDSLRGIAALTVVFHHFLLVIPIVDESPYGLPMPRYWKINLLKFSPLHLIWAGHEAVILFFVLSGFVLSLPFLDGKAVKYSHFLIKRICRIYLPYFSAITIAIVLDFLLSRHGIPQLSGWFQLAWTAKISKALVLSHYFLLGTFDNAQFDPVIWSLVQEMRISLFFPLVVYLVKRFDWKIVLIVGFILYIYIGFDVTSLFTNNDLPSTARYLLIFVIGILLAKHRVALISSYKKIPAFFKYALIPIALLCYVNTWLTFGIDIPYRGIVDELLVSVGVCLIVISALASVRLSKILLYSPITYLGKISYSLYLFHAIVLLTFVNVLFGRLPLTTILIMAFITALGVSILAYHFIELPSMKLGKYLTRKQEIIPTVMAVEAKSSGDMLENEVKAYIKSK